MRLLIFISGLYVIGCDDGAGVFAGAYRNASFSATLATSSGPAFLEDDLTEMLVVIDADTNGTEDADMELKLTGSATCDLFARRANYPASVLPTRNCVYTAPNRTGNVNLDVQGGSVSLAYGVISIMLTGDFAANPANTTGTGTFTASVLAEKQ